jgi:hypothetical protein
MIIKILCNKLLLGRATSQLASCTEPSRAGSLFSRATKTGSARARSERRAKPSCCEPEPARRARAFFPALDRTPGDSCEGAAIASSHAVISWSSQPLGSSAAWVASVMFRLVLRRMFWMIFMLILSKPCF